MNFDEIMSNIHSTDIAVWVWIAIVALAVIILFLPVILGASRGLSGAQQIGVFIATFFGFWIIGLVLAIVMRPDDSYR